MNRTQKPIKSIPNSQLFTFIDETSNIINISWRYIQFSKAGLEDINGPKNNGILFKLFEKLSCKLSGFR